MRFDTYLAPWLGREPLRTLTGNHVREGVRFWAVGDPNSRPRRLRTFTKEGKPVRMLLWLMLGVLGVAGCSSVTGPGDRGGAGNFRIVLDQPEYTRTEASQFGISATVTNTSESDFYSKVGDSMNSALEQPTILAALGTHAVIERRISLSTWKNANAGLLFEGSRFVVLRAGRSYHLAGIIAPDAPGIYRIRLDYSTQNNDPSATMPFHDFSAAFRVR